MLLAFLTVPLPSPVHRPGPLAAAAVLNILIVGAVVALPWERLPNRAQAVPVFAYILVIALLRESEGGTASGYGALVVLPILWLALYGTRGQLLGAIAAVALVFLIPVLASGPPRYPIADLRRGLLFVVASGITGFAVQELVRAVGNRATEARRLAREHEQTERRTKAIIDSAQEAFVSFKVGGSITRWNPQAEKILGYSAAELEGRDFCDTVLSPSDRESFRIALRRFSEEGASEVTSKPMELEAVRRDGSSFPAELALSATAEGESHSFHAFLQDITERRRAEQHSLARQAVSRALAESATVDEAIQAVLEAIGTSLGWEVADFWALDGGEGSLECRAFWRAPHVGAMELESETRETVLGLGEDFPGRVWLSRALEWVEDFAAEAAFPRAGAASSAGLHAAVAVPVAGETGVTGILELFSSARRSDESGLHEVLEQLAMQIGLFVERKRAEEEADRLKDQFVALVSHELRTPLTSIIGYLELLEEEAEVLSSPGRRFVSVMDRNAKRLLRLVEDLLFVARLRSGSLEVDKEPVDVMRLASDAVETGRVKAQERRISLSLRVDDVPPVPGDEDRLGQLLDNLITNALKFTPEGGRVEVTLVREDGHAVLEVADSGPGIPSDEQERLFEPFYRATSADEQAVPGTGLGLSIAKAIVDSHCGRIGVESEADRGATFRVELPYARDG